jgi:hypothetical protein
MDKKISLEATVDEPGIAKDAVRRLISPGGLRVPGRQAIRTDRLRRHREGAATDRAGRQRLLTIDDPAADCRHRAALG